MLRTVIREEILDQNAAFRYQLPSFEATLKSTAPDVILLVLFSLIFFAAAFYSFIR